MLQQNRVSECRFHILEWDGTAWTKVADTTDLDNVADRLDRQQTTDAPAPCRAPQPGQTLKEPGQDAES
jgi:hypothetical protein